MRFCSDVSCQLRLDDALLRAGLLLKKVLPWHGILSASIEALHRLQNKEEQQLAQEYK